MKLHGDLSLHGIKDVRGEFYTLDVHGRAVETVKLELESQDGGFLTITIFDRPGVDAFCAAAETIIEQVRQKREAKP